jgi:hypothetical protein
MNPPDGFRDTGETVMSNFDRGIDKAREARLRAEAVVMHYAAWCFSGQVWFRDGQFHCLVSVHGRPRQTITSPTLDELMVDVSSTYGSA